MPSTTPVPFRRCASWRGCSTRRCRRFCRCSTGIPWPTPCSRAITSWRCCVGSGYRHRSRRPSHRGDWRRTRKARSSPASRLAVSGYRRRCAGSPEGGHRAWGGCLFRGLFVNMTFGFFCISITAQSAHVSDRTGEMDWGTSRTVVRFVLIRQKFRYTRSQGVDLAPESHETHRRRHPARKTR